MISFLAIFVKTMVETSACNLRLKPRACITRDNTALKDSVHFLTKLDHTLTKLSHMFLIFHLCTQFCIFAFDFLKSC